MSSAESQPPETSPDETAAAEGGGRSLKAYGGVTARGFAMGCADIVPGVSGGTMAFILGIYEELIDAIASFTRPDTRQQLRQLDWKGLWNDLPWRFLLALAIGILAAVFLVAGLLDYALEEHKTLLYAFFFGLIAASIVVIGRHIHWRLPLIGVALLTAVLMFWFVGLVPAETPSSWWFFVLAGALASCAMILPGISGAYVLLLLGKYEQVIGAVESFDLVVIALVGFGAVIGLLTFARFVSWLFRRYHDPTIAVLTGLMLGSLRVIWPWKETLETTIDRHGEVVPLVTQNVLPPGGMSQEVLLALGLAVFGFVLVWLLERQASGSSFEVGS